MTGAKLTKRTKMDLETESFHLLTVTNENGEDFAVLQLKITTDSVRFEQVDLPSIIKVLRSCISKSDYSPLPSKEPEKDQTSSQKIAKKSTP